MCHNGCYRAFVVTVVRRESPANLVQRATRANPAQLVRVVSAESLVPLAPKDQLAPMEKLVLRVQLVPQDPQEPPVLRDLLATKGLLAAMVRLVNLEILVLLVLLVKLESLGLLVNLARPVLRDTRVYPAPRDPVEKWDLKEMLAWP